MAISHPLDPLTTAEVNEAASLAKAELNERAVFASVVLQEPRKDDLHDYKDGDEFERTVKLIGYDFPSEENLDGGFIAYVNLTSKTVSIDRIVDGQAPINFVDVVTAIRITKEDEGWQAAMRKRGVTDFEWVQIDPWPAGGYQHPSIPAGHRAHRAISFVREFKEDNGYAHPIQGLIAHIDLTREKVAHLEDFEFVDVPSAHGRYDAKSQASLQANPKPLHITQPDGVGFTVESNEIKWHNWQFRVSIHPVNGLVFHQVGYHDEDRFRTILHRAAMSDMVVPYGDIDPMHHWKHVLDAGEASIGDCLNSLEIGCDCVGEIVYLDHVGIKANGESREFKNAICIHEEDYGILWKHRDGWTQTQEVRRSRRLVVSTLHTVGNYEYGFYWYFYLDGTIQVEVKLTGIVGISAVADGFENAEFAPLVAPNVASPIHQHLFCFRLDFEIDGRSNSVHEINVEPYPVGEKNEDGTAFYAKKTLLKRELQAKRNADHMKARIWTIENTDSKNALGKPAGYTLMPGVTPVLHARQDSQVERRAGFARHNLWVTPFEDDAFCAAGDFPNLSAGDQGLRAWTRANRDIENQDVVVWHTFGVTHLPRPEDWPVMPVEYCGFTLKPAGFFNRNPALNLPGHTHAANDGDSAT